MFFKQNTAYDVLSSDWSSDVCSSDLRMNNHYSDYVGSANPAVTVRSSILVQFAAMGDFAVEMPGYSRGIGFDIGFPVIARREMREDDLLDARGGGDFADLLPGDRKSTRLNSSH